ncbi:hypothetical protein OIK40_08120 [Erythrobacter sp. sf7]|uniref:Uncharacterized protein n=1 Tax=Erythrobacter fulvus TaxID=2987523 RepID=A0ABT5JQ04_9SPHN|nr:hypothetical protein [Erythrobacter fulvus]MDC8754604.1 hypothetical protein [Erythrobacter fulvus]
MNLQLPYVDRIWRAKGEVIIDEPLAAEDAFARLDPLFQTPGTSYAVAGDTLTYSKKNPAAQDKLATFTSGALTVDQKSGVSRLSFHVSSTALLLCFLAPLLFLGFAQIAHAVNAWEASTAEVAAKEKSAEEGKDEDKDKSKAKAELHWIDKLLGAPEPDDPTKKKDKGEKKEKIRTTPAYVLAGLFFVIYLVGRVLEPWLLKRTFRAALSGRPDESVASTDAPRSAGAQAQPDIG